MDSTQGADRARRVDVSQLVVGGGEMGKLVRAMDWSKTPLGPIEAWSPSLLTTVSICIASNFPIAIAWGPGHVMIYNDGYSPICGPKHPRSMGQDFSKCWASAWPAIGDAFERALEGESSYLENQRMFLDRKGFLEEAFFTFSFSPIRDETGAVGGLFHPVTEVTATMLGERRLRALRDMALRLGKAATVAEVFALLAPTLREHEFDLPFVLVYALDASGKQATLEAHIGLEPGTRATPVEVDLDADAASFWPLGKVARSGAATEVHAHEGGFEASACGPYPELPTGAVLLPLTPPGLERPAAILVAGVSARLELNEAYRAFYELVAGAITTALANANAHEEERKRAEALAEIDRAKTAFFSNVSHEFRTPLTLMLGPTEDALASESQALGGESLEAVHRNELRLLKLVNTLLDFARIEAGRAQASFEATDLSTLTRELASAFESAIAHGGLDYRIDCAPVGDDVLVDRDMWEKIVLNLISNALKFTFEGTIRVALRRSEGHVELDVADTGVGIAEVELPRLFERFHRIEGSRSRTHEGSGIGLALVHDLVALLGGELRVASRVGHGTTFTVSIPTGRAHLQPERIGAPRSLASTAVSAQSYVAEALRWMPQDAESAPRPPIAVAVGPFPDSHILVADDNADMRQYVCRLLAQQGWSVEAAPDGVRALAAIGARRPDVVIADVMMPNLDGFGLLHALRVEPATASLPVILLSARAGEESRVEGLDRGASDYLIKPFSARELVARVQVQLSAAQLRRSEQKGRDRLNNLFLHAPMAIAVLQGPEHVFDLCNPAYQEVIGNRAVLGKTVREAFPEVVDQGLFGLLDQVYQTGEPFVASELPVSLARAGTGTLEDRKFTFVYQPLLDDEGRVEGVLVVAVDVSDQVALRRAVEDREERLRLALEASRLGDWELDLETGAARGSSRHLEILGYAEPVSNWTYDRWLEHLLPEDREGVEATFKAAVASPSGEWNFDSRVRRADGTLGWIEVHGRLQCDERGRRTRMQGTSGDITDRKLAEEERKALLAREAAARADAEAANRTKDEFLAILGHEMRNPLAPIATALQLMRLRDGTGTEREREVIERQVNHLVRLVDDLLDVSRITSGKIELKRERLELGDSVAHAIEQASPLIEQRQQHLAVSVPRNGLPVDADETRLAQVIANLLTNAAKYTERGGSIALTASREGEWVALRVRDTGIGITEHMLPRVFDLFAQERQSLDRSQGGLGLGLAIVRSIVALHGGTVTAHSDGEGRGSEFTIRLPVSEQASAVAPSEGSRPARRGAQSGRRVLVVDDNPDAAELLADVLHEFGCHTRIAYDGPSALRVAEEWKPEVALLDIGLPVMDGYELARRLRTLPSLGPIRLIAVTGYGQEGDLRQSAAAGFDLHLVKPISFDRIEAALTGALT